MQRKIKSIDEDLPDGSHEDTDSHAEKWEVDQASLDGRDNHRGDKILDKPSAPKENKLDEEKARSEIREIHDDKGMEDAIKLFDDSFADLPIEAKKQAVETLFNALSGTYKTRKYRGKDVELVFRSDSRYRKGYSYSEGFINIPLDKLEADGGTHMLFAMLHEYRHAMQKEVAFPSGFSSSDLDHDTRPEEIDATKFAFSIMDEFGADKTKLPRYKAWEKAIGVVDKQEQLERKFGKSIADSYFKALQYMAIYRWKMKKLDEEIETSKKKSFKRGIGGRIGKLKKAGVAKAYKKAAKQEFRKMNGDLSGEQDPFMLSILGELDEELKMR
jgi:hypothetical protein